MHARCFALLFVLLATSAGHAQSQLLDAKELVITLSGNALFSRSAQEGIMLAIPWKQLVEEFFPRRDVRVVVEYGRGEFQRVERTTLTDDARNRPFDPKRANYLLSNGKIPRFNLRCQFEVCHVMKWLSPFLYDAGIKPMDPRPVKEIVLTKDEEPAALWMSVR